MIRESFRRTPGYRHLVNLPFVLVLLFVSASGAHEGIGGIWPYLPLLLVFAIQLAWPTVAGWFSTVALWIALALGVPVYDRVAHGVTEFSPWFLLLWGILPLLLLFVFRPSRRTLKT
jgi:hypothetical protein